VAVVINTWQVLKVYLNSYLMTGQEKSRKDILTDIGIFLSGNNAFETRRLNTHTVDTYLNYLHKAGYLYKPKRGVYGLTTEIEIDLSIDDVKNMAYGRIVDFEVGHYFYDDVSKTIHEEPQHKEEDFFKEEEFVI